MKEWCMEHWFATICIVVYLIMTVESTINNYIDYLQRKKFK